MTAIEAVIKNGVIVPLKPLRGMEGKRVHVIILEDPLKAYAYKRLVEEGEDASELFEI